MYKKIDDIVSSYAENGLGFTLYQMVIMYKPKKIIDIGLLNGYSTVAMALGLKALGQGEIVGYDLFDDYEFNNAKEDTVNKALKDYGVDDIVTLEQKSLEEFLEEDEDFDLLHVDVSNTGATLRQVYDKFKGEKNKRVFFEGGTAERDRIDWMIKYDGEPMRSCGVPYTVLNHAFPSISRMELCKEL